MSNTPITDTLQDSLEPNCLWIDRQTPSTLVVKQRLKRFSYAFLVIWSILFAGIPMGLVILLASQTGISTLACQKNELASFDCDWSTRSFLGLGSVVEHQLVSQVVDAQVESAQWSNARGGGTEKMWVTLTGQSGHVRLFETAYALGSGYRPTFQPAAAAEIRELLILEVDDFLIKQEQRFSPQFVGMLGLAMLFVVLSIGVAYGGLRSRTLILDKSNHRYSRQVHTLLGMRVKHYALDEITSIKVKEVRHHRNGRLRHLYRLELCLRSHKKHRLPSLYRREVVSKIVVQMQSFIQTL